MVDDVEDTHDTGDAKSDGAQRLRSRMTHNSVWNCDGEIIEEPSLDVRLVFRVPPLDVRSVVQVPSLDVRLSHCGILSRYQVSH